MFKQNEIRVFLSALFLLALSSLAAAQSTTLSRVDLFKTLKTGQWIQIEGVPQRDMSVLTTEAKILTGDFEDDDWEISGMVRAVSRVAREFEIFTLKIKVTEETDYGTKDKTRPFVKFDDLKDDMFVQVDGTFMKDGSFLAEEVKDKTSKKKDEADTITLIGKVERSDATRRTITLMGVTFMINDQTRVRSAIK